MGLWSNGTTPAWRAGNAGSTPAGSTPSLRSSAAFRSPGGVSRFLIDAGARRPYAGQHWPVSDPAEEFPPCDPRAPSCCSWCC